MQIAPSDSSGDECASYFAFLGKSHEELFPRNLVRAGLWQGRLKFFKNRLLYLIAVKYNIKLTGLTIFKCTVQ